MKNISYALIPFIVCSQITKAEEITRLEDAKDANVISCTIVLYKDKERHMPQAWAELVEKTMECIEVASRSENKHDSDRIIEVFSDFFATIANKVSEGENGIKGEISIGVSDGQQGRCCGEVCACPDRYAGNCPCEITGNALCVRGEEKCCDTAKESKKEDKKDREDRKENDNKEVRKSCCGGERK